MWLPINKEAVEQDRDIVFNLLLETVDSIFADMGRDVFDIGETGGNEYKAFNRLYEITVKPTGSHTTVKLTLTDVEHAKYEPVTASCEIETWYPIDSEFDKEYALEAAQAAADRHRVFAGLLDMLANYRWSSKKTTEEKKDKQ